jgi:hypothetical protein
MRLRAALKWILGFSVLALATGPSVQAGAQTGGGSTVGVTGATSADTTPSTPRSDGQVGFERKTTLTPQEQLTESQRHIARLEILGSGVRKLLEDARRRRDVVKTLCLTDKLSQMDVANRTARDHRKGLEAAIARTDTDLAVHEFTIITVLRQRGEELGAASNQCVGEESAFVGDTRTTVKVDPLIAQDETAYPATDPTLVMGPAQCQSCTL